MSVIPSGRFPSLLDSPAGSFMEGTSAHCNALAIKSLMALCLAWRTGPSLHESPCKPLASTIAPQTHWCGLHNAVPRRSPTATRTSSFSKRSPHETIGRAYSQSLLWGAETARRRALSRELGVASKWFKSAWILGLSHALCLLDSDSGGYILYFYYILH